MTRSCQLRKRPFEDQLESCQLSYPYQSLLEFHYSNKKDKNCGILFSKTRLINV